MTSLSAVRLNLECGGPVKDPKGPHPLSEYPVGVGGSGERTVPEQSRSHNRIVGGGLPGETAVEGGPVDGTLERASEIVSGGFGKTPRPEEHHGVRTVWGRGDCRDRDTVSLSSTETGWGRNTVDEMFL